MEDAPTISAIKDIDDIFGESSAALTAPLDASVDLLQGDLGPSTATWDSVAPSAAAPDAFGAPATDATTGRLSWGDDLVEFMSTGSSHAAPVAAPARESMWDDFLGLSQPAATTVAPVTHDLNFSDDLREFWVHSPRAQPPATASYDFIALDSPAPAGPDPFAADASSQGILLPSASSSFPSQPEYAPSVMAPSAFEIPSPVHNESAIEATFVVSDSPAAADETTELSFAATLNVPMDCDFQDGAAPDETTNVGIETDEQDSSEIDVATAASDDNASTMIGNDVDGFLEAATYSDASVVTADCAPCDDSALASAPVIGEDVGGFLDDDEETDTATSVLDAPAAVAVGDDVAAVPPTPLTMDDKDSTVIDDAVVSKESINALSSDSTGVDLVEEHTLHDQVPDHDAAHHDTDGAAPLEPAATADEVHYDDATHDSTDDNQVPEPTLTTALEPEEVSSLRCDDENISAPTHLVDATAGQFSIDDDEEAGVVVQVAVEEAEVIEAADVIEAAEVIDDGVGVPTMTTASVDTAAFATAEDDTISTTSTAMSVDAGAPTTATDDETTVLPTDDAGTLGYNDNVSNFATEDSHSVYQDLVSPVSQVVSHLDAYEDVGLSDDDGYVAFSEPSSPDRFAAVSNVSSPAGHSFFSFMNPADNDATETLTSEAGDDVSNMATEDSRSVYQDLVSPASERELDDPMMMVAPSPSASTVEFTVTSSVDDDDEETTTDWTASNSDQTLSVGSPAAHHEALDAAFATSTTASAPSDDDLVAEKTATDDWAARASTPDAALDAAALNDDTTPGVNTAGATSDAGEVPIFAEPVAPAVDEPIEAPEDYTNSTVEAPIVVASPSEWVDSSAADFSVAGDTDFSVAADTDVSTFVNDTTVISFEAFTASSWQQSTTEVQQEDDTAVFSIDDAVSPVASNPWLEQNAPVDDAPSSTSPHSASGNDVAAFETESTTVVADNTFSTHDDDVGGTSNPWLQEPVPDETATNPWLSAADTDRAPHDSTLDDGNPWLQSSPPPAQPTNPWLTTTTKNDDDDDGFENLWATAPAVPALSAAASNPWFTAPAAPTPVVATTGSNPWLPSTPAVPSSTSTDSCAWSPPAPADLGNTAPWTERAAVVRTVATNATSSWLSAGAAKVQQETPVDDDFGDFVAVEKAPANEWATSAPANDGGWGAQSSAWAGNDDDDDDAFGDFGEQADDDFASFEAPATSAGFASSFDSFAPPAATPPVATAEALFAAAFPVPAATPTESLSMLTTQDVLGSIDFESTQKPVVCSALLDPLTASLRSTHIVIDSNTTRDHDVAFGLKQAKFALTQKVQEAVVRHGLFLEHSPAYAAHQAQLCSNDKTVILDGLHSLQAALFADAATKAMLSIAEQAALSAQASIAEQSKDASKGSSLTRQFLNWSKPDTAADDSKAALRVLTPTGASISKLQRTSFATTASASGDGDRHSGSEAEWETASDGGTDEAGPRMTRTASGSLVPAPTSSSSGLMKKFSSKLGFSGLRTGWSKPSTKTSTLTLRRKGDKATRTLELQLESISGGFDEIKWKCALFLFDADEVASTAPSQIQVFSSSGAILSSKTDKGAVQKLFKDKASVWTIDIGASRESTEE
ncbi:hypothetical protein SDRG_09804 [Saprolegnia diclina VS20]|uniref:Uncharacterized protein n=1 Tax=Saprolegnia diclina (strain VS20) TaxID=1156394 RepID=T0RR12_SAPDV|nr:hypothetical protein SDRG_09804 [Saprolegnia diclina VS20]EQC32477.1 hypothetical protein SDRG_09804 [Saprolegnia diclina VS20]|eukprot:XP_008613978.1 hypothetical protein SDRG_09804 [Saprolegnia diclina VS20]